MRTACAAAWTMDSPFSMQLFCEFHNQNRVLTDQADGRQQTDLEVHVVVHAESTRHTERTDYVRSGAMNLSASSAKPADPTYFLEGIIHDKSEMADFEGPLSLILLLLSKNKIEIRDIKISEILDQYLEYLNAMEKLDLEIASEFVQMASYLLYIKTRMLLTEEKEVTELEQLIASLEQLKCKDTYAAVKSVTPMLDAAAHGRSARIRHARRSRCRSSA